MARGREEQQRLKASQVVPVFCPMLCSKRGYLVRRCISVGIMSFSCRRRHRGRLSAS
jgi:hypothetical protein